MKRDLNVVWDEFDFIFAEYNWKSMTGSSLFALFHRAFHCFSLLSTAFNCFAFSLLFTALHCFSLLVIAFHCFSSLLIADRRFLTGARPFFFIKCDLVRPPQFLKVGPRRKTFCLL